MRWLLSTACGLVGAAIAVLIVNLVHPGALAAGFLGFSFALVGSLVGSAIAEGR